LILSFFTLGVGGATVDFAGRAKLVFKEERKKPKNIYWNYHEEGSNVKWIVNETLVINNITLRIPDEVYDWKNNK
jgi:hypothetical protein